MLMIDNELKVNEVIDVDVNSIETVVIHLRVICFYLV